MPKKRQTMSKFFSEHASCKIFHNGRLRLCFFRGLISEGCSLSWWWGERLWMWQCCVGSAGPKKYCITCVRFHDKKVLEGMHLENNQIVKVQMHTFICSFIWPLGKHINKWWFQGLQQSSQPWRKFFSHIVLNVPPNS